MMNGKPNISPDVPEELQNSMDKILNYSGIPQESVELFKTSVDAYFHKERSSNEALKLRDTVISLFFEIYREVAKKVWAQKNTPRLYQMFLKFGYMDERLLGTEYISLIYNSVANQNDPCSFSILNLSDWLHKVYEREIDPSVDEFEQDYFDVFRSKRKKGELTDRDKLAYDSDIEGRLIHEVNNLFKMGHRLCYGRTRGYFPILCNETMSSDLSRALVTPAALEKSLNNILQIDYSAFYREAVYHDSSGNTPVTYIIMKSALPDIIFLPVFGSRGVMWQEIAGRVKTSSGRFIFPIFTEENIDTLMLNIIAKFRWELSKNISGSVSNRGFEKSLYSDYTDYIQTYKKNRHLSTDMKEKIRLQIDRKRNNVGEIFAEDYITWITYESKGLLRLNKEARTILFKYCPFAKPIRDNLLSNPQYNQIITQYNYGNAKLCGIWESKTAKMPEPLHQDLIDNLNYYKS